ncbi:hypothetical protein X801_08796 [Opisthorchis viverrini]|uniref:Uncharacterized protein n=1 Tax=Opisthorchis viverrini TaxID=6198 RepID=A0A1S8WM63_OPIVI|nr:hypothetical protein X801_08796 [Opisthorchis viverrini]
MSNIHRTSNEGDDLNSYIAIIKCTAVPCLVIVKLPSTVYFTIQYIQKKSPNYAQVKNETVWTIDQLNDYINRYYRVSKCLPFDWVKTVLQAVHI